jgi:hypothetical protein
MATPFPHPLENIPETSIPIHRDGGCHGRSDSSPSRQSRRNGKDHDNVDLGHIDLLVQEGFYSNRTDFIRTAIRNQLLNHGEEVRKVAQARM